MSELGVKSKMLPAQKRLMLNAGVDISKQPVPKALFGGDVEIADANANNKEKSAPQSKV